MSHVTISERVPRNLWFAGPSLLVFSALAAVLPASRLAFGADPLGLVLAIDLFLTVCFLLGYLRRPPFLWLWATGAVLVPLGAALSGTNSSVRGSLLVGASLAAMCLLLPPVLTRLMADRPRSMAVIAGWFIAGQTVSALAGVAQFAGIHVGAGLIFGRATGLAGHPNTLGVMAALAIVAAIALWGRATPARRWLLGVVALMNALVLVSTGSLSAILAAVAAVGFGVVAARRVIGTAVSLIIILAGGFATTQLLLPGEDTLFSSIGYRLLVVTGESDGSGGAASLDIRDQTYEWAWRWIEKSPVVGVGMDPLNAGTFDGTTVVHNFLLRGWYQGGLPVVLWLTLVALVVLTLMARALRRGKGGWPVSAAFGVLVFGFTAAFLNQPTYWLPLIFAILVTAHAQRRPADLEDARSPSESLMGHSR
ncbi:hypothetical protein MTS1_02408 [Microbacterium sp. TS-1]|uniref:O-antigen ligase family protein n=1 Tax=Microbacterium sp. TS-1 TaxID=1344956 RepID=UPI00038F99FF|nr:hypothetical protein [Microbacterium sp. TS-1]GAD35036.1 hypothetical protein MTS1_02408 [Microbacterium sp. TS-1]